MRIERIIALLPRLTPLIGVVLFALAMVVVHKELAAYHRHQIVDAIAAIPGPALALAGLLTLLGYLALTGYDWLALEYAAIRLPYRRVALAALLSYAISNNVGHALLSGGSMRYRLYSGWGVPLAAIAKVVLFCTFTYLMGAFTVLLLGYLGAGLQPRSELPHWGSATVAGAAAALLAAWWLLIARGKPLRWRRYRVELPGPWLSLRQTAVAALDMALAGLVLYVLLRHQLPMPLASFLFCYIAAQLLGLFSQVPGGIGVFESTFLLLTADHLQSSHLLAGLIVYRIVYYLLPLLAAGALLLAYELRQRRVLEPAMPALRATRDAVDAAIPRVFSLLLLVGGAVLLFSGTTPAVGERLHWLTYAVPLPLMELSHLAGSIAGVMLLILAGAVRNRIDAAWYASVAVLAVGIVASLAKGWDYEEALILSAMLLALLPTRRHFYRHSTLLRASFSPQWLVLVAVILLGSVWLGLFSYKHVEYGNELWWQFSLRGDAPRFLRSSVAAAVVLIAFVGYRLLARSPAPLRLPDAAELDRAAAVARRSHDAGAFVALTGDKYLLWSDSGNSFLAFGASAGCWVVMGDPVGDPGEFDALIWKLREQADRARLKTAWYEVGTRYLPLYLDQGMSLLKLGEEARVALPDFNLEGKARAPLRQAYNKGHREGLELTMVAPGESAALLPELRAISSAWLASKKTREKRFSVGYFDEGYLARCRLAVLRQHGRVVAFANLWELDDREEFSIDLMRYAPEAPRAAMEYLFVALMLWGRGQGYQWFSLGMAPLSGLGRHPLAPRWHKVGNTLFRLGQEFYNFEGLYHYKAKFQPDWRPRYLAAAPGLASAAALLAATQLIAGGIKGIFSR